MSSIIAESEERLERVRDAILKRKDLIQDLREKLQFSSNILFRRENKLEEKINQENSLKSEVQTLRTEKNDLQTLLKEKTDLLEKEKDLVRLKDIKIRDLTDKSFDMEKQLNDLHKRMSETNKELTETRHCLWSIPPCRQCSWMRKNINKLEYQLERYRYANYDYSTFNRAYREQYYNQAKNYHYLYDMSPMYSPPQPQFRFNKQSRAEAFKRQQAFNRSRVQDFRNASQILSPIREDAEEPSNANKSNQPRGSGKDRAQLAVSSSSEGDQQLNNASNNFSYNSCNYLTVRTGSDESDNCAPKNDNTSMAYLHIASSDLNDESKNNSVCHRSAVFAGNTSTPVKHDTNIKETALFHQSADSTDDYQPAKIPFIRSFPFLNSSLASCSSVASTESPNSDTTARSSDSGLTPKTHHIKRLKTRRSKRKQKSNLISFRGHKIDITKFTIPDFRQIMWSLGGDSKTVDEFLNFLSSHAKRLKSDPYWSDKHSLGSPEEWNALKKSY